MFFWPNFPSFTCRTSYKGRRVVKFLQGSECIYSSDIPIAPNNLATGLPLVHSLASIMLMLTYVITLLPYTGLFY